MLSQETLDVYRRMTPGQRLSVTLRMMKENTPYLLKGSAEVVARRFTLIARENDARNQNMLAAIARTRKVV
ncbi:MAG TPA: hypothetical protein VGJ15_06945 [Pirellulales bacterium]|jgi:hypothetical protein